MTRPLLSQPPVCTFVHFARLSLLATLACWGCENQAPKPQARAQPAQDPPQAQAVPQPEPPPLRPDGTLFAESELMGTRVTMNVWVGPQGDAALAGKAIHRAFDRIDAIEQMASEWRADSDLNRLNAAAGGDFVRLPRELLDIFARAATISAQSEGAFDITFYAVGELWSFKAGAEPPKAEAIAQRLPLVNWRAVELDAAQGRARLRTPGMKVGLGAIAKGYAVDAASRVLRDAGFANHVVEGGGDTYASGTKGGESWKIGVQHPHRGGALGALALKDLSVVTSGNYMRFFEWEGRRYTHILDPSTGFPILEGQSPRSVTCVAKDATDADAYCTALAVMGRARAMQFVADQPGLDALIIDHDDRLYVSDGLSQIWENFEGPVPNGSLLALPREQRPKD